jgi:ADP-ribose pyrophosphatase YjhB (NUDIX family)
MPAVKTPGKQPDIQLIANAVVTDGRGRVLLTRYDDDESTWWLPGRNLEPYEHPDEALQRALAGLVSASRRSTLHHVESFRGRRGWHVTFNFIVEADADAASADGQWFAADQLPATAHGKWEQAVIAKTLAG